MEDDSDVRALVLESLRAAGYDARTAADGLDGLRSIVDDPPDLILTDVLMPGLSGIELCILLKASPRTAHIPVMFLSCVDDVVSGFDVGADDYLVKPFRQSELLARVRAVFRRTESIPPALAAGGLRGNLTELSLPEILQTLHIARASGCLTVVDIAGIDVVRIWLDAGESVAAQLEGPQPLSGEKAIFRALEWADGVFSFDSAERARSRTLHSSLRTLLLEAARLTDERKAGAETSLDRGLDGPERAAPADRAALEDRINEIREQMKVKALAAPVGGRLQASSARAEAGSVERKGNLGADEGLPDELNGLIERMLGGD